MGWFILAFILAVVAGSVVQAFQKSAAARRQKEQLRLTKLLVENTKPKA